MRYFIEIAYNGGNFFGWQIQPNVKSVQGKLNECLSLILREPVYVIGAGRTDTGVHARQMFAHFETSKNINSNDLIHSCNSFLNDDIAVKNIFLVDERAHARFDAESRLYRYYILRERNPFLCKYSWYIPNFNYALNQLNDLSQILFKYSNFSSFAKSKSNSKTNICRIMIAEWNIESDFYIFTIKSDRFLRNMIRAVVGTIVCIIRKEGNTSDFCKIIESENRGSAGLSAPARGLFLEKIEYPKWIFISKGQKDENN